MKALLLVPFALCLFPAPADLTVDGKIPAGNVIVKGVEGDVVKLSQDLRDSRNWFYWAFRVTGAEGRTVRFDFVGPSDPVSCRGPAVTKDGGRTWAYAAEGHSTPSNFVYTFAKDEREVWFYQTFQYYPRQWEEFLARHAADRGKVFETGVLCKSRKGRDVPKARFGKIAGEPRYRVWLSSRTHCGEAPATYVVEGWLERVFARDALGAWLRENVEFLVVPFVDFDGATDGDQGKGRKPHDHNRDYVAFLYPESRAIAAWLTEHAKGKLDVAIDCHSPWVRNRYNEKVYQTYHADEWNTAAKIRWGALLEKYQDGSMNYSVSNDFPWRFGWNGASNTAPSKPGGQPLKGLGGWIGDNFTNLLMNSTYEIPFANASGKTVTPESCRAFGAASAKVLKTFLERMRPLGAGASVAGDPNELIPKTPVPTRFQWDEYWGNPVTEEKSLAVDFARENAELHVQFPAKAGAFVLNFNTPAGCVARLTFTPVSANEFRFEGAGVKGKLRLLENVAWFFEAKRIGERRYRILHNENVLSEFESPATVDSISVSGKGVEIHGWAEADPQVGTDVANWTLPLPPGGCTLSRERASDFRFCVPNRSWSRLKVVCRTDPAASAKAVPVLTARVTSPGIGGSGPVVLLEKTVDLRDAGGAIAKKGSDYVVAFDIKPNAATGKAFPYLQVEFAGPSDSRASSVQVFSASLEAEPLKGR